ncbi:MAG: ferredoxin [Candidatus Limnocylindrales bacterium]
MDVEVTVDPDLCIGSGDCARLVPTAFRIDETLGVSVPLAGAASADPIALRQAARGCPTQAIRIVHGEPVIPASD